MAAFRIKNIYKGNGAEEGMVMVQLECTDGYKPDVSTNYLAVIDQSTTPKQMSFLYHDTGHPRSVTDWRTGVSVKAFTEVWELLYPNGDKETVDILTSGSGDSPRRIRIPDPWAYLRRYMPFLPWPPKPIYRRRNT